MAREGLLGKAAPEPCNAGAAHQLLSSTKKCHCRAFGAEGDPPTTPPRPAARRGSRSPSLAHLPAVEARSSSRVTRSLRSSSGSQARRALPLPTSSLRKVSTIRTRAVSSITWTRSAGEPGLLGRPSAGSSMTSTTGRVGDVLEYLHGFVKSLAPAADRAVGHRCTQAEVGKEQGGACRRPGGRVEQRLLSRRPPCASHRSAERIGATRRIAVEVLRRTGREARWRHRGATLRIPRRGGLADLGGHGPPTHRGSTRPTRLGVEIAKRLEVASATDEGRGSRRHA